MLRVSNRSKSISTNSTIVEQGLKRKALSDITNNVTSSSECKGSLNNENNLRIITPPNNIPQRIITADLVRDYFLSMEKKILFKCPENQTVYECLSRRIDCFDDILSRKLDTSEIIHKVEQKRCKMSPCQKTLMIQRMQYLQCAYKNVLSTNIYERQVNSTIVVSMQLIK